MSSLAVPSSDQLVLPIPNGTRVILKQAIDGFYIDKKGKRVDHTVEKGQEVHISSSGKKGAPTRGSTGLPDPKARSVYEYLFQIDLPEKEWEQFKTTGGIITQQPIPHNCLSEEKIPPKTAKSAKNLGSVKSTFWTKSEVGYIRDLYKYKAGRQTPSGSETLNVGDIIVIQSGPLTQSKSTPLRQDPIEHNLKKAHYDFQQASSIGMKIPTWTSEYYHDPSSFEVVASST